MKASRDRVGSVLLIATLHAGGMLRLTEIARRLHRRAVRDAVSFSLS